MGNYTSSCFFVHRSKSKTAKLLDLNGNISQIKVPVKAAELMLEHPGFVVSPLRELRRTGRLIAMRAEDELLASQIYLFVPLSRVNRKVSESEMEILESAAAASLKKRRRAAKVSPSVAVTVEKTEVEGLELEKNINNGFAGCRLENYRHWTPVLEPIREEP